MLEVCMIREFPRVPWESHGNGKRRLNSWEWELEWEWCTGNGREMGIVVWKKFPSIRSTFNHCDVIGQQSNRIRWKNAKLGLLRRSRSFEVVQGHRVRYQSKARMRLPLVNNTN